MIAVAPRSIPQEAREGASDALRRALDLLAQPGYEPVRDAIIEIRRALLLLTGSRSDHIGGRWH
jgi:hypothetical protein